MPEQLISLRYLTIVVFKLMSRQPEKSHGRSYILSEEVLQLEYTKTVLIESFDM